MNGTNRAVIKKGLQVAIIQKQHQKSGIETTGIVQDILTNSQNHHRGIKVRLECGTVGRIAKIISSVGGERISEQAGAQSVQTGNSTKTNQNGRSDKQMLLSDYLEAKGALKNKSETIESANPLETWNCKACTYINGIYSSKCEMCDTQR